MCIRRLPKESGGWGVGDFLHMNINLDSTKIILTGHKIVASFFLQRFWQDTRGHIYAYINIFRLRGKGGEITLEK